MGAKEARVAVKAIGLNFADIFAIKGLYSATPKGTFVPGLEYAGEIAEVGAEVSRFKVGDKVYGVTKFGGYTDTIQMEEQYLMALPEGWSFAEGAAFPVQVLTAYYGLFPLANLQEGATVLIQSAAGGVGLLANRLAKTRGAYTIGSIGSDKKIDLLKSEGYDAWIVRDSKNFKQQLKDALGDRELNVALETQGGKVMMDTFACLAPMGRMVSFGSARFQNTGNAPNLLRAAWQWYTRPKIDPMSMTTTNRSLMAFNLIYLFERAHLMHQYLGEISEMGIGAPHVGHTFPFEELHEAVRLFSTGATVGKVVVEV
ncbi:MAG TPA: zinc-binding dehydrogenase [Cytophagales bacterium]|nr:zinc-binding dehydrogenase [Cytophagales bacterium]